MQALHIHSRLGNQDAIYKRAPKINLDSPWLIQNEPPPVQSPIPLSHILKCGKLTCLARNSSNANAHIRHVSRCSCYAKLACDTNRCNPISHNHTSHEIIWAIPLSAMS